MNTYTLTDTAETIADNPEGIAHQEAAEKDYAAYGADLRDDCLALLHSVSRRLSGHEIAMCQAAAGQRDDIKGIDCAVIDRLRAEFPREIAQAKEILARR
jgi:hypothetical protein